MSGQRSLARRALEVCRNQLFFENRFLEQALFRLKWEDDGAVAAVYITIRIIFLNAICKILSS